MRNDTKRNHPFFSAFKAIARFFCPCFTVEGRENVSENTPAVFICNHSNSRGPIIMELFFPYRFRPWVTYEVTAPGTCWRYLEKDFTRKELKLKRPLSSLLAMLTAPICILVMKAAEAIPVYRGDQSIFTTFSRSARSMAEGYHIVIFPEEKGNIYSNHIFDFYRGFAHLARKLHKETGITVDHYPIYIDTCNRKVIIGKSAKIDPREDFNKEKERLAVYLRGLINSMAEESASAVRK